jgi:hypothetical protein
MEKIMKYVFEKLMVKLFVEFGKKYPEVLESFWNNAAYYARKYPPLVEYEDEPELIEEGQLYFFGQYLQVLLQVLAPKLAKSEKESVARMFNRMIEICDWNLMAMVVATEMGLV